MSGVLLDVVLIPIARTNLLSLPLLMAASGLCFLPLGYGLGLSIACWISRLHPDIWRLPLAVGLGGALYGAVSFLSTAGAIVGLGLLAIVLAASVGVELRSVTRATTVGVAVLFLILACVQLWRLGDATFLFMMSVFDPTRTIAVVGLKGIAPIVIVFYGVNLIVLVALWRYGDVATP